jgi:hypothetical protein
MYEESIYNLIPKDYVPPPKEKLHHSKHDPRYPPTGSTFINFTTSRPKVFIQKIRVVIKLGR